MVDFNPDTFMSEYNFSMLSRGISGKNQTPFRALVLVPRGKVEKGSFDLTGHLRVALKLDSETSTSVIKGLFLR